VCPGSVRSLRPKPDEGVKRHNQKRALLAATPFVPMEQHGTAAAWIDSVLSKFGKDLMIRFHQLEPSPELGQNGTFSILIRFPQAAHHMPAIVIHKELTPVPQPDCFELTSVACARLLGQASQLQRQHQIKLLDD